MKALEPPDTFYFAAAIGWLELGNKSEAEHELKQISRDFQEHPDVLELRWTVAADEHEWERCAELAGEVIRVAPDREFGWIHRSYSLHEMKRTQEAWESLLPAANIFPEQFLIPYNLSCYASQLGNLDEARFWLSKAILLGGLERVRAMAKKDDDLKPLWTEIEEM